MQKKSPRKATVTRPLLAIVLVIVGALALSGCVQLTASKAKVTIKPGKSKTVKITAYNPTPEELEGSGNSPQVYPDVQVCAESPKFIKVTPKCRAVDKIEIGESITGSFKIKVLKSAKKKKTKTYTVWFTGSDPYVNPDVQTRVRVKVPKVKKK